MSAAERPVEEVRAEHYSRIGAALDRLRDPSGIVNLLDAYYLKAGTGSWTNLALMASQAPGQLVENHYGWTNQHGIRIPKGRNADVFLSNGRLLPTACWSQLSLNLGVDYLEERTGEVIPAWDGAYCRMLAESWGLADDDGATAPSRVRLLNAWAREVEPRLVEGEGLGSPRPESDPIPF